MIDGDMTLAGEGPPAHIAAAPTLARGDEVGRYVLLAQLGRGAMGVVYAAFDPQLDRKVALKVLHHGPRANASEGQPRLLREAQALAKLSHPNVIAVHDVGLHHEAVFIAMEFVDGQTLGAWAEAQRAWRERVRVLIAAGRGLAAAHRAGIVHRDFKPDNVMLDGEDRPRVLDFGLARAAAEDAPVELRPDGSLELALSSSSLDTKLTETGALMGTPAYMAPEQYAGQVVDARSDQFAFCVSAYETLYGERPFAGDSVAALAFAIHEGRVREAPRDTQVPSWLRKVLLRGLATDPDARWPGMDALLEALARDPVRRRRSVLLGAALAGTIVGLALVAQRTPDGPRLCTDAASHLEGVWDEEARATLSAGFERTGQRHADATTAVVTRRLDDYAAAWVAMRTEACEATRIRGEQSDELLGLRMACLDRSLARLDSLVAVYRTADTQILNEAVDALDSLPPLARCADLDRLSTGVRPPDSADARAREQLLRARLDKARALEQAGKRALARTELATLRQEVLDLGYAPLSAELSLAYGAMLESPDARVEELELAVWKAEASRHDRIAALAWIELIHAYGKLDNNFAYAEMAVKRAGAAIARLGEDEQLRIRLLVAHGGLRTVKGDHPGGLELQREARAARVDLGQTSTSVALEELVELCNALMTVGLDAEAAPLLREAIAEAEAAYGLQHPWGARLRSTLGRAHYMAGDFEAAEAALLDALAVFELAYGGTSNNTVGILNGLAIVHAGAGHPDAALEAYARALDITIDLDGEDNLRVAQLRANIGDLEHKLGHPDAALEQFERALATTQMLLGEDNPSVAKLREKLAAASLAELDDVRQSWGG